MTVTECCECAFYKFDIFYQCIVLDRKLHNSLNASKIDHFDLLKPPLLQPKPPLSAIALFLWDHKVNGQETGLTYVELKLQLSKLCTVRATSRHLCSSVSAEEAIAGTTDYQSNKRNSYK